MTPGQYSLSHRRQLDENALDCKITLFELGNSKITSKQSEAYFLTDDNGVQNNINKNFHSVFGWKFYFLAKIFSN